jgi:hypothetical protein
MQEAYRKDVERAFGVLQARFNIIRTATRMWNTEQLDDIMYACVILHNMIVKVDLAKVRIAEVVVESKQEDQTRRSNNLRV